MLSGFLKKYLPNYIVEYVQYIKKIIYNKKEINKAYKYDLLRYSRYSDTFKTDNSNKLIGKIIRDYHVIEKGLTMPETRLGFGKERIISLIKNCLNFISLYGESDEQINIAINVILEYCEFHKKNNFELDSLVNEAIIKLKSNKHIEYSLTTQKDMKYNNYFSKINSPFPDFAATRSSIRNFRDLNVNVEDILESINIAKSTPSACNRQCWRTYLYQDKNTIKKILDVQGGNRGFGHLVDKLIVVTAELGVFITPGERNQAFIDGGMYVMNLLYSLHYNKIGVCTLNCSNDVDRDIKMRNLCSIGQSEVFIAMLACGIPAENFKIANSFRYNISKTHKTL